MEEKTIQVPYIVHEASMVRMERINKRLFIALIVAILSIFVTNGIWIWAWNQYEYVGDAESISLETRDGNANFIGNDGSITNGEDNGGSEN